MSASQRATTANPASASASESVHGEDLKQLRQIFGWTQEKLAEALNVDVSTVSRWERNRTRPAMTGSLIKRIALDHITQRSSRIGAYIDAVLDPKLRAEIDHFPGHRYLAYGKKLILLHMSKEAFEFRAPWTYWLIGTAYSDYMVQAEFEIYEKVFVPLHDDKEFLSSTAVVKYYSKNGIRIKGFPSVAYREWTFTQPYPLIFDVMARSITQEQYEAQTEKIVFIPR